MDYSPFSSSSSAGSTYASSSKRFMLAIERQFLKHAAIISENLHFQKEYLDFSDGCAILARNPNSSSSSTSAFGSSPDDEVVTEMCEYGIHLCDAESCDGSVLNYWIVGRVNEDGSEIFVCFEDSIPQSIVEMGFRMMGLFL